MMQGELKVQYQLFVQNPAERRFVASVIGMPTVSEEGTTEEEAVFKTKAALEAQLANGKIINIKVQAALAAMAVEPMIETDPTTKPSSSTFPMQYAGVFTNDSSFDDWVEKLALIRREANAEADE